MTHRIFLLHQHSCSNPQKPPFLPKGLILSNLIIILLFLSYQISDAAIIQRRDSLYFSSSVHVNDNLRVEGNYYPDADWEPMVTQLGSDSSTCEGGYKMQRTGNFSSVEIHSVAAKAMLLDGNVFVINAENVYRLNLETMGVEGMLGSFSHGENRATATYFTPRLANSADIYVAGGWDESGRVFNTTWKFNVRTTNWHLDSYHPFETVFSQAQCALSRCYLHGGLEKHESANVVHNILFEYNYEASEWKNQTTADSPGRVHHRMEYLPQMDVLVLFGGSKYNSTLDSLAPTKSVDILRPNATQWEHYPNPAYVGGEGIGYIHNLFPTSLVYKDTIYILTLQIASTSYFMKLLVSEGAAPEFHFVPYSDGGFDISEAHLRGSVALLLHNHALIFGGAYNNGGSNVPFTHLLLMSLC